MIRRSPRLVSKGYYHPQEPRSQLVSYKEPNGRTFNTRKRKKLDRVRRNLFNKSSITDIENTEAREVMLPPDILYQEDDTPPDTPTDTLPETPPETPPDISSETPPDVSAASLSLLGSSSVDYEKQLHRALSLHRADDVGMADYALGSLEIHAGNCWPFKGSKGHLVIDLPYPIRITHVTLQHLPRVLSPTNQINSAPKDFAVYDCPSEAFQQVELRILSNWGHEYTCVYRFRLHSQPNCTPQAHNSVSEPAQANEPDLKPALTHQPDLKPAQAHEPDLKPAQAHEPDLKLAQAYEPDL
ncbi:SUN domain-containing protein 1 [Bagarius yarrelli]|uniref:SUN domain-containing protein 1 n=1 Tax=Bagarius yarrelli TaxID=175774 RepID=A0A556UG47_BAGYA|nr:SUN domain-containing protein 1 [Bagarius yarrelli]